MWCLEYNSECFILPFCEVADLDSVCLQLGAFFGLPQVHTRLSAKCSAKSYKPYNISLYFPHLLVKGIFLCTNPGLSQYAISNVIIPRSDISNMPKANPIQGFAAYVLSHLLHEQKSRFMTEILSLPVRWLPRECSAAGTVDLERFEAETE